MPRTSVSGNKELMSLFIDKNVAQLLRDKATKEHRKISAQAEIIFSTALQEGTTHDPSNHHAMRHNHHNGD